MSVSVQNPASLRSPDHLDVVTRHKSYRGLTVEHNMLAQFTMYTVHLENLGIFISDSRPEAFSMAFEALFSRQSA
jgi:hypothetical protein